MNIDLTTNPSSADAKFISQGLQDFNLQQIPELEPVGSEIKFSIFARDDTGEIQGGLRGLCFWNTLHVELLWVSEEARGQGLGTKLMSQAEAFAREKGYGLALLESSSWQAKPFYEKLGYQVLATLPEHPKGYATHFLVKTLI